MKLIIVDKSEIFRDGLKKMLEREQNIQVVHTCATLQEDSRQAREQNPDILIICAKLTECSRGAEEIAQIHKLLPHTNIIALCDTDSDVECIFAIKAGARACISRYMSSTNLVRSINLVADGEVVISSTMARMLLEEFKLLECVKDTTQIGSAGIVSDRERDVLNLVAQGLTNRQIATTLSITEQTVKVHLRNIMGRLHAHTREQAVALLRAKNELGEGAKTSVRQL